jgi:hypothetical protein
LLEKPLVSSSTTMTHPSALANGNSQAILTVEIQIPGAAIL